MRKRARRGFTLLEMMTVLAIIGITAAMAIPQMRQAQANGRLRGLARDAANVFHLARQRAITTGKVNNMSKAVTAFPIVKTVSLMGTMPACASRKCPGVAMASPIELERPWCQMTKPEKADATNKG